MNHSTTPTHGSAKKQDRRVLRTKRSIHSAFLELMKQKELHKITIKELSELADINRKTFYAYYDSVSAVLSDIENQIIGEFQQGIEQEKKKKPSLSVSDLILCIGDMLTHNKDFIHQLVQVDALEGLEKKVQTVIKEAMRDAISESTQGDNTATNLALEYIITGAVSMYIEWFSNNHPLSLDALTTMTVGLVKSNIDYITLYNSQILTPPKEHL